MKRAFTLVEVLFALSISAMVMVGACFLMFNMAEILQRFEETEPFEEHVNGVEIFLKNILKNSQIPSERDYSITTAEFAENKNLGKGNPPDSMMGDKSKLYFGVLDDIPFFISRRGFSPEKDAWLDFRENDGLYILWTFAKNENYNAASDDRPIYESLVSPYITSLAYVYIDEDGRWIEEDDMDYISSTSIASNQMPNFIKIVFERGKETHTRYISLIGNVDPKYEPSAENDSSASNRRSQGGGEGGGDGGRGQGGGGGDGRGGRPDAGGRGADGGSNGGDGGRRGGGVNAGGGPNGGANAGGQSGRAPRGSGISGRAGGQGAGGARGGRPAGGGAR